MLSKLKLRFGSSPGQSTLDIDPRPITIFVGPNNSGKSALLREIDASLENPGVTVQILDSLTPRAISQAEIDAVVASRGQVQSQPGQPAVYHVTRLKPGTAMGPGMGGVNLERNANGQWEFRDPPPGPIATTRAASLLTVFLDGKTRLSLLDNAPAGSLHIPPQNHLAALFRNDAARARIAQLTSEVFGEFFTIDPTPMTEFHAKLSPRAPVDIQEERATDARAIAFHAASRHISAYSDGVKAYTGLLSAVSSTVFKLILIDEPEAFLHPPLARRLGRNIAELASTQQACVIAATHDADFVMGAVQSGTAVNVVRLTYRSGVATARHLPAQTLTDLMRDPLLRSAGVIRSLFHAAVVVCEADADRAFYEEINDRLALNNDGVADGLFLNVQNKQTIRRVIGPLRSMGIPAAAVVDLDIFKGNDLEQLLDAAHIPSTQRPAVSAQIAQMQAEFVRCNAAPEGAGLSSLDATAQQALKSLLARLASFGIFVVPVGELENWLVHLGVTGKKKEWLPKMFGAMGADAAAPTYVRPANGDVWQFIRGIRAWALDPNRGGIPS